MILFHNNSMIEDESNQNKISFGLYMCFRIHRYVAAPMKRRPVKYEKYAWSNEQKSCVFKEISQISVMLLTEKNKDENPLTV